MSLASGVPGEKTIGTGITADVVYSVQPVLRPTAVQYY